LHLIHAGPVARLSQAARLYRSIAARSRPPLHFSAAIMDWRIASGNTATATARSGQGRAAVEHAGLLCFRVMALQLLGHIELREAPALRRRAGRMIAELEHTDLEPHTS
jgi:hypothetical protein